MSPTTTSAQLGGPSNTTQNTLPNCIPWLATSVGVSVFELDSSVYKINSNYQLQILENGLYWITISITNNTTSNFMWLYTSGTGTNNWTIWHRSTTANSSSIMMTLDFEILIDDTNWFIQI